MLTPRELSIRDALDLMRRGELKAEDLVLSWWDVAYAALFLASDEAKFISGVSLPVDGSSFVRRG